MEAEQIVVAVWNFLCVHVLRRALYPSIFWCVEVGATASRHDEKDARKKPVSMLGSCGCRGCGVGTIRQSALLRVGGVWR
jgi:hypothetical protein